MSLAGEYKLSEYQDYGPLDEKEGIHLLRQKKSGRICVKKGVDISQREIVQFRKDSSSSFFPEVLEYIENTEGLFIIEEYIEGITLEEFMMGEPLEEKLILKFAMQICQALECLHSATPMIIYRDLKAENVMITCDQEVKLTDFHISRQYCQGKQRDTQLLGTAEYAAPEQFGYFQTDNRTDIYAFGILLNYMLTGKFPVECLNKGKYASIIKKCIELEPNKRYQNVREIVTDLNILGNKETDRKEKITESWVLPGFRSRNVSKMILAAFGYIILLYMGLTLEFTNLGEPYPQLHQWVNRLLFVGAQIVTIFVCTNYRGMGSNIRIYRHPYRIVRILGYVGTWFLLFVFAALLSLIFDVLVPV